MISSDSINFDGFVKSPGFFVISTAGRDLGLAIT